MNQVNKNTGKISFVFAISGKQNQWPFGQVQFRVSVPLLTFTTKLSSYRLIPLLAWWISMGLGAGAHFCSVSNLQNNVYKFNTSRVCVQMAPFRWEKVREGLREQGRGQGRDTHGWQGEQAGCSCNVYKYTQAQQCSCSYTWAYAAAFLSPLNSM